MASHRNEPRPAARRDAPVEGRPLLLVDVDGVISLFGFELGRAPAGTAIMVEGIPHLLSAHAGPRLLELAGAFELVWCSGWEEKANDHLPRALGLPGPLPYLVFGEGVERRLGHWKLDEIERHAAHRPLAWIDDRHDEACADWARARVAPTLLVTTDPAVGVTEGDVRTLLRWAAEVRRP